eukprot:CAMPEP_0174854432 /NCGR_PEP_ID=MMETSP1114-20130205/31133_1 /TAXON_ID=312471 /ORGANISM="Neobodo designis, Strain CCAP 1951/1" /LENGTH=95 /DNA_ID=CAMNT_0016089125 /DNA_START=27 /DNA_END=310 /DNA_ORIENTATION=+
MMESLGTLSSLPPPLLAHALSGNASVLLNFRKCSRGAKQATAKTLTALLCDHVAYAAAKATHAPTQRIYSTRPLETARLQALAATCDVQRTAEAA